MLYLHRKALVWVSAPVRSSSRPGRPQSHDVVGLPGQNRTQSAKQYQVHIRPQRVAARANSAAARRVAYIDWAQQEFGIAAALSGDTVMMEAYRSGDPYLAFAKQAGAAPADAPRRRTRRCGISSSRPCWQSSTAWARVAGPAHRPAAVRARELLRLHRETYRVFWRWSDAAVDHAMLTGGCRPCSAGGCRYRQWPTSVPCETSRCRPTVRRCCAWPAAWRPSRASRSARRSTMRC